MFPEKFTFLCYEVLEELDTKTNVRGCIMYRHRTIQEDWVEISGIGSIRNQNQYYFYL